VKQKSPSSLCTSQIGGHWLAANQKSYSLKIALWLFFLPWNAMAQSGFHSTIQYGHQQKINGFEGEMNAFFLSRSFQFRLDYQREWEGKWLRYAGAGIGYRNFSMLLKSEQLAFYDNSHHQQTSTFGNDGAELHVFAARRLNDFTNLTAGLTALYHFPGSLRYETELRTNPNYSDSALYRFTDYKVTSAAYRSTKGKLSGALNLGLELALSDRTQLMLGYQRFFTPFEGVSEVVSMEAGTRSGGKESMGYMQSYSLPMRYWSLGLKYRLKR
jgi:hypothetical protein